MAYVKPLVPRINYANPLTQGLLFDSGFREGVAAATNDLLNNVKGTIVSSGATWKNDLYGTDLDFSASASSVTYTTPAYLNSLTALSIEALVYIRSSGGGSLGRVCNKAAGSSPYWMLFIDGADSNKLKLQANWSGASNMVFSITPSLNAWHHVVVVCSDITNASPTVSIYLDGVSSATSVSSGAGSKVADDTNFYIGNRSDGTRNFDGKIGYIRVWNRQLQETEAKLLNYDPFWIYKSRVFFPKASVVKIPNKIIQAMQAVNRASTY